MSVHKPRESPAVTVDVVVFTIQDRSLSVLLVRRCRPPFRKMWALPGGFVGFRESLEAAARRELKEETGIECNYLEQLYTFGDPHRDPRTRVMTVTYFALLRPASRSEREAGGQVRWFPVYHLPPLAFDHRRIVDYSLQRLQNKLSYTTMGFQFLPRSFTLTEVQRVYEIVFNRKVDKRNFRKKVLSARLLADTRRTRTDGAHRPAQLYALRRGLPFFLDSKLI